MSCSLKLLVSVMWRGSDGMKTGPDRWTAATNATVCQINPRLQYNVVSLPVDENVHVVL